MGLCAGVARADVLYVSPGGDDVTGDGSEAAPWRTIQHAIDQAVSGDLIQLADATYTGAGNRDLAIGAKSLTLMSAGGDPEACTIDAELDATGSGWVIDVDAGGSLTTSFVGLTITGGVVGGIRGSSPVTLENCTLDGMGVGVADLWGYGVAAENCRFVGCGKGLLMTQNETYNVIRGCSFVGNVVGVGGVGGKSEGGAVCTGGAAKQVSATFEDCVFDANGYGVNVELNGGFLRCEFLGNTEAAARFAVAGAVAFDDCRIHDNPGDGVVFDAGGLTLTETEIAGNGGVGLDIRVQDFGWPGTVDITRCTVADNGSGIAGRNSSDVAVTSTIVAFNSGEGLADEGAAYANCNVFANGPDAAPDSWLAGIDDNISSDPLFCDAMDGDYALASNSQCAAAELIGAHDVGCDATSFLENTPAVLAATASAAGPAWGDFDDDGDWDVYLPAVDGAGVLAANDGGLSFHDATSAPLDAVCASTAASWGDYDNDGLPDLYVAQTGPTAPNRLFRNLGGGAFEDFPDPCVADPGESRGVSWVDYDRDGFLDLYVPNVDGSNLLLRNDRGQGFSDRTPPALDCPGNSQTAAWGDYDNDGDADLYLVAADGPNQLFVNDGGLFTDVAEGVLADAGSGRGAAWGDYNNDGYLDLFLTNWGADQRLLAGGPGGAFRDVPGLPLGDSLDGRGIAWGDYDNDGDLDLFLTFSSSANVLLRNDGADMFTAVEEARLAENADSVGAAWCDADQDGDLDLYVVNDGTANRLYENIGDGGRHWLRVKLRGTFANSLGIGARVRIVTAAGAQIREINGNAGYVTQEPNLAAFGLGDATVVDTLRITWPLPSYTGLRDTVLTAVPVDTMLVIEEIGDPYFGARIVVDAAPDSVSTPWRLEAPGGVVYTGVSDTTLSFLTPGDYVHIWQPGVGWAPAWPETVAVSLPPDGLVTVSGTYGREPYITSVTDVPDDQGGQVRLTWNRSAEDAPGTALTVTGYGVFRCLDEGARGVDPMCEPEGWEFLTSVDARADTTYHYVAPTLRDSTAAAGIQWSTFLVRAVTTDDLVYLDSRPAAGYSVDNLAPAAPTGVDVAYAHGGNTLTWVASVDGDVDRYEIHRVPVGSGQPEPDAVPAFTTETPGWTDDTVGADAWDHAYWLRAVDVAGNRSTFAGTQTVSEVGDAILPRAYVLGAAVPNPFNPATTIRFSLPCAAAVSLRIYDMRGRLIHSLVDGATLLPGRHQRVWRGEDDRGRQAAAGVYFYRLETRDFIQTRQMTLVK